MPQMPTPLIINSVMTRFSSINARKCHQEAEDPARRHRTRQNDGADLIGYRLKGMARPDNWLGIGNPDCVV